MSELMAACVEIWESDPETLAYHGSGYIALGDGAQVDDLTTVHERQQQIGYPSQLILGEAEVAAHMRSLFADWRAPGLSVCLHERAGGFAYNRDSMLGLASKARAAGARDRGGRRGHRLRARRLRRRHARADLGRADRGRAGRRRRRAVDHDAVGDARPAGRAWRSRATEREMWTYWYLQEGEIDVDPAMFVTNDGALPPVLHVDSHAPLHDDDGGLVTAEQWGIYYKQRQAQRPGRRLAAAEGARVRSSIPTRPAPSSPGSPTCGARRSRTAWRASRARRRRYRQMRSGGVGAFTADNFPVFDHMRPNVFVAADSNHGYKMIAVGREIARVLQGEHSDAAASVPLRALRHRRPAPGLEQPVPLELMASHVVVGGGVNGLSVAWRLAERGADVLVLDKGRVGGGATGSAGGIVRNYYRAEAITELVAMSVEIFESEPDAYGFRQVGYLAAVPAAPGRRPRGHPRAARAGRLRVRARRGRRALPRVPVVDVGRLGRSGRGAAARAPRRLGRRDADRAPPGRPGARRRGGDPRGRRGRGVRARRRRRHRDRDERGPAGVRDGGGRAGAVDRRRLEHARAEPGRRGRRRARARSSPTGRRRRASSRCSGVGLQRRRRRPAGRAPRPERAAALGSRRPRARPRRLGHLLPHRPRRHHRRRAADPPDRSRSSTPTAPTTPRTSPSRSSPSSSPPAWPPRCGASADAPTTGG